MIGCSSNQNVLRIDDLLGVRSETGAPVTVEVKLNKEQLVVSASLKIGATKIRVFA